MDLLNIFGKSTRVKVIQFFLENQNLEFKYNDIAKKVGIAPQSAYKNLYELANEGIVKIVGHPYQNFKLNTNLEEVKNLSMFYNLINEGNDDLLKVLEDKSIINQENLDSAGEIEKFYTLKKKGIIDEGDFELKKQQLLSL